jgi:alpha-galactosidase
MQAWYRMFEESILDSSAAGLTGDVVPGWDDEVIALMLEAGSESLLAVWSRGEEAEVALPGLGDRRLTQVYPASMAGWKVRHEDGTPVLAALAGPSARIFTIDSV